VPFWSREQSSFTQATRFAGLFDLRPEDIRPFSFQRLSFSKAGKGKATSSELKFHFPSSDGNDDDDERDDDDDNQ
jgi:hypothetical protein